jgi:hypothetical protein
MSIFNASWHFLSSFLGLASFYLCSVQAAQHAWNTSSLGQLLHQLPHTPRGHQPYPCFYVYFIFDIPDYADACLPVER